MSGVMQDLMWFSKRTRDFSPFSNMSVNLSGYKALWIPKQDIFSRGFCQSLRNTRDCNALGLLLQLPKRHWTRNRVFWTKVKGFDALRIDLEKKRTKRERKDPKAKQPRNTPSRDRVIKDFRKSLRGSFAQKSTQRTGETRRNKMGTNNRQFVEINTSQQQIIFISQSRAATRKMLTTIQIKTISNKMSCLPVLKTPSPHLGSMSPSKSPEPPW